MSNNYTIHKVFNYSTLGNLCDDVCDWYQVKNDSVAIIRVNNESENEIVKKLSALLIENGAVDGEKVFVEFSW